MTARRGRDFPREVWQEMGRRGYRSMMAGKSEEEVSADRRRGALARNARRTVEQLRAEAIARNAAFSHEARVAAAAGMSEEARRERARQAGWIRWALQPRRATWCSVLPQFTVRGLRR